MTTRGNSGRSEAAKNLLHRQLRRFKARLP